jgi:DNA-binding response OmpR family regulator
VVTGERPAAPLVLLVDDEAQIVRAIAAILRGAGFAVATAATGEEAMRAAALRPPAAILLDLGLPDTDGVTVCRRIRSGATRR